MLSGYMRGKPYQNVRGDEGKSWRFFKACKPVETKLSKQATQKQPFMAILGEDMIEMVCYI